ncbi:MAG: cbb3-type cytochrome c oxidase subunit 3 [Alphaproteobacteria bacterium]|nr:cbb3-type cytochrome c oxidase subunit 3 [Alphaproteobacteria bacterium]MBV9694458.1 cbb3-type cytochrome c oxidase subunit 3 [Alphaproteobacteria bacterium]
MERWAYEDVLAFAQSWGAVYFIVMFAVAFVYALWPANREGFVRAAYIPLKDVEDV